MIWTQGPTNIGDIVRVKMSFYYHYGIYIGDEKIVQFGYPDNSGVEPDDIRVVVTDVNTFLSGGMLETALLSKAERLKRRSADSTVKYALSKVGMGGYHILHNNCEHFVNDCVFGISKSELIDETRKSIRKKLKRIKQRDKT